jgi:hypothetical protein
MKTRPEELLAAWAHRPASLSTEERRAVEELVARSPEAAAEVDAMRAVIAQVAGLPAEGTEPVWGDLERSIRAACDEPAPGVWRRFLDGMRGWKPAAGLGAGLVVAMAALALWIGRGSAPAPAPDDVASAALAQLERAPAALVAPDDDMADDSDDTAAGDQALLADWGVPETDGLVGDADLGLAWIDDLDDDELDAVSAWLDAQEPG